MKSGILIAAFNVPDVDMVKLAAFNASRIKSLFEDISITVVTNSADWMRENYDVAAIDDIISYYDTSTRRLKIHDGTLSVREIDYPNISLRIINSITPYDRTLLIEPNLFPGQGLINVLNKTSGIYTSGDLPIVIEKSEEMETFVGGGFADIKRIPFDIQTVSSECIPLRIEKDRIVVLHPKPKFMGQYYPTQYVDVSLKIENVFALSRIIDTGNGLWN